MENQIIDQLLSELMASSISTQEYKNMIDEGKLVKRGIDDIQLDEKYPSHPLASSMRFKRIDAAEEIREIIVKNPNSITNQNLDLLNKAVFDCCATVRLVIVQALGLLSQIESLDNLQRLLDIEDESDIVKKATQEAIRVIKGELKINEGRYIRTELVYS